MVTDAHSTDGGDRTPDPHAELPIDPDSAASGSRPLHLRPMALLLIFAGGVLGTGLRYLGEDLLPHDGAAWPWATFLINVSGAFVLGAVLEGLARFGADTGWRRRARLFAGTGFCGAFTTYSTLALETSLLGKGSHAAVAIGYGLASVVAGIVTAWLGIAFAASLHRRWGHP